jgi:hypothetical protein
MLERDREGVWCVCEWSGPDVSMWMWGMVLGVEGKAREWDSEARECVCVDVVDFKSHWEVRGWRDRLCWHTGISGRLFPSERIPRMARRAISDCASSLLTKVYYTAKPPLTLSLIHIFTHSVLQANNSIGYAICPQCQFGALMLSLAKWRLLPLQPQCTYMVVHTRKLGQQWHL